MKRMIVASTQLKRDKVVGSEYNRSSLSEAVSLAEALKYVLDDMKEEDYQKGVRRCPDFYSELETFIKCN